MTAAELRACLALLELNQREAATFLAVDERTVRRWCSGETAIPAMLAHLVLLMIFTGKSATAVSRLLPPLASPQQSPAPSPA